MPRGSKNFWRIEARQVIDFFTEEWGLKLMALLLAFLLWTVVQAEEPEVAEIDDIEVEVENSDRASWHWIAPPEPATVTARISGPARELLRVAVGRPSIHVPIEDVEDSVMFVPLERGWVRLASQTDNVLVEALLPPSVELRFERIETKSIPVAVRLTGSPVPGFEQEGPVIIEPAMVAVVGPRSSLVGVDTLHLPPLDLSGRSATERQVVVVDPPKPDVTVFPPQVEITVPIGPIGAARGVRPPPPANRSGGG